MADIGHNSGIASDAAEDLIRGLERIERLREEKKGVEDDIKDVFLEYKAKGFDNKTMRKILDLRKMKPEDRKEMQALLEVYADAVGLD